MGPLATVLGLRGTAECHHIPGLTELDLGNAKTADSLLGPSETLGGLQRKPAGAAQIMALNA
jgi:hypothetical protein